jgi:hypothetical protein
MMNVRKRYIVFYKEQDPYWEWEEKSISYENEDGVMSFVSLLSNKRELEKIYSVNEYGTTKQHEVVFEGRLKLREVSNS